VVGGHDDHGDGQSCVCDTDDAGEPAAAPQHRQRDQQSPSGVDGRQRGVLVGQVAERRVDALPVDRRRVDESGAADESWWRDRDRLDQQRDGGERDDDVAPVAVAVAMTQPQPSEEDDHSGQVCRRVVVVRAAHEPSVPEDQLLERRLGRHVQDPFQMPHPPAMGETTGAMPVGDRVRQLPEREQRADETGLVRRRRHPTRDAPAAARREQGDHREDPRDHDRAALVEMQPRHTTHSTTSRPVVRMARPRCQLHSAEQ
jgi:hypothetical protein